MSHASLIKSLKTARLRGVPLVGINTPDPNATIRAVCEGVNGECAKIQWDYVRGLTGLNDPGREAIATGGDFDDTLNNPVGALVRAQKFPAKTLFFIHLANRWLPEPSVIQAAANLRDEFKANSRMCVFLGPAIALPPELGSDVVIFDEPLPDAETLSEIVQTTHEAADLACDKATLGKAVEAIQGLPAFAAEQVTALCLQKKGIDLDALWERKRQQIEQTPGLKVFRGGETFDGIGGVPVIKDFLKRIIAGRSRPNAIVFIDEIEKMLAGSGGDTSGVTQDQLGSILSYMQDRSAAGVILIGPPGAAKSAIAKATGNHAGIPTIQLDLGAAKGSLVGQSEQQLRSALKVITAVSNGRSLWIATCNSIGSLPPELRRRFTLGTFFFDLPEESERRVIWDIYTRKYELGDDIPNSDGWTGAEIKQCCDIAWRLGCTLTEAAAFIVPVAKSAADQIERLRAQAEGRFLSASRPGVYSRNQPAPQAATPTGRKLSLEE